MRHLSSHNEAFWAIVTQLAVIILLSPMVAFLWNRQAMGSWVVGGLICALPNIYLYRRVFSHFGANRAKQICKSLYSGEAVKLILTAIGFVGATYIAWILPVWVFVGYIGAQVAFGLTPVVLAYRKLKKFNQAIRL